MRWTWELPFVFTIAARPVEEIPMKESVSIKILVSHGVLFDKFGSRGKEAARIASTATDCMCRFDLS